MITKLFYHFSKELLDSFVISRIQNFLWPWNFNFTADCLHVGVEFIYDSHGQTSLSTFTLISTKVLVSFSFVRGIPLQRKREKERERGRAVKYRLSRGFAARFPDDVERAADWFERRPPRRASPASSEHEKERIVSRREYCYANWISMTSHRSSLPIRRDTWESWIFSFPRPRVAGSFPLLSPSRANKGTVSPRNLPVRPATTSLVSLSKFLVISSFRIICTQRREGIESRIVSKILRHVSSAEEADFETTCPIRTATSHIFF